MIHFLGDLKIERPKMLSEAIQVLTKLQQAQQNYLIYAGGTDLVPYFKNYPQDSNTLISLSQVEELKCIRHESEIKSSNLKLGSQIKLADLVNNVQIKKYFSGLNEAASEVASPQIRNQATLGGNLLVNNRCRFFNQSPINRDYHDSCYKAGGEVCHVIAKAKRGDPVLCRARFVSDLAPVLMVLEAQIHLLSGVDQRVMLLKDFYLQDGIERNQLKRGEVLTFIEIDTQRQRQVAYEKLRIRNAIDFPSLGVAVGYCDEGVSRSWHIALTGVHTHPIYASAIQSGDAEKTVKELSAIVTKKSEPLKQDFFKPTYRRQMVAVLAKRALARLIG